MTSFSMDTRWMSSSPLVNRLTKNRLFKTAPDTSEPPFQFIHTMDFVCGRHDAAWQPTSRSPQDSGLFGGHRLDARKSGVFWRSISTVARARRGVPVHCPAGTQSCYQTLRMAGSSISFIMTSWNSVEEVSKRYHQNFLLCNNIEIYRLRCRFIQQFLWRSVCGLHLSR